MKIDRDVLDQAHYLLRPLMLRRLKSEVETKLPPRRETKVVCPLAHVRGVLFSLVYNFSHSHHSNNLRLNTGTTQIVSSDLDAREGFDSECLVGREQGRVKQ